MTWLRSTKPEDWRAAATGPAKRPACHTYATSPPNSAKASTPIHPVIVGDAAHGGALARIHAVAPGRVVRDAVGRIGHHQPGDLSRQEVVHVHGIGGIAAEQAVPAQREEIAPHDVGGAGSDDRVLVGLPGVGALAEEPFELLGGPEETEIEPVRLELLQDRGIPVEVEFADPVVRDRQGPCAGITTEVEVLPLDRDQILAVGLDDMQWEIQAAGLLDGLVPSDSEWRWDFFFWVLPS